MGASLYAIFEASISEAREVDGKMLSKQIETLDAYAERQGLQPLSAFISVSTEMREFAIEEGVDPEEIPPEAWFDAELGLATVRALRAGELGQLRGVDADLAALENALAAAKGRGIRFHMVVDG